MITQGTVLAIPLEKDLGYAYAKCIYTGELGLMPNLMLKVYNRRTYDLNKNHEELVHTEELCYRILSLGAPLLRGKHKWFKVSILDLTNDEANNVPSFKEQEGGTALIDNSDWSLLNWTIIENFDFQQRLYNLPYTSINHLGLWMHSAEIAIRQRLTMFWIKKLGKSIRDFYSEEEIFGKKNFWTKMAFNEAENIVFYDQIPKEYWGKARPI